ncbi:MAG: hypothetical protein HN842_00125 [Gammaproteobacteria bacterium]|jgi:hypothetical protein|nr:hypothetical protein [Gammaproteobacteria bacterium]
MNFVAKQTKALWLITLLFLVMHTAHANPMRELAQQLLQSVEPGKSIALRPIFEGETALPQQLADHYYQRLLEALQQNGKAVRFIDRKHLRQLQQEQEQFSDGELDWQKLAVDLLIIPRLNAEATGVRISATLVSVKSGATLASGSQFYPGMVQQFNALPLTEAIHELGQQLFNQFKAISPPSLTGGRVAQLCPIIEAESGVVGAFGDELGRRVIDSLNPHLLKLAREQQRNQMLRGEKHQPSRSNTLCLSGTLRDLGDSVTVSLNLEGVQESVSELVGNQHVAILKSTIPESLLPLTSNRVEQQGGWYSAAGSAVVSDQLERQDALLAARNMARARIVANRLGRSVPENGVARSAADSMAALQLLGEAIPYDESWINPDQAKSSRGSHLSVKLEARIKTTATPRQLPLQATLLPSRHLRAGAPFSLRLHGARSPLYLGVFGWFSDNSVVRLYPSPERFELQINPNQRIQLPSPSEMELISEPPPGQRRAQEALIIAASPRPIDFNGLAPLAGESITESQQLASTGESFFNALAQERLEQMRLILLPYEVYR